MSAEKQALFFSLMQRMREEIDSRPDMGYMDMVSVVAEVALKANLSEVHFAYLVATCLFLAEKTEEKGEFSDIEELIKGNA